MQHSRGKTEPQSQREGSEAKQPSPQREQQPPAPPAHLPQNHNETNPSEWARHRASWCGLGIHPHGVPVPSRPVRAERPPPRPRQPALPPPPPPRPRSPNHRPVGASPRPPPTARPPQRTPAPRGESAAPAAPRARQVEGSSIGPGRPCAAAMQPQVRLHGAQAPCSAPPLCHRVAPGASPGPQGSLQTLLVSAWQQALLLQRLEPGSAATWPPQDGPARCYPARETPHCTSHCREAAAQDWLGE